VRDTRGREPGKDVLAKENQFDVSKTKRGGVGRGGKKEKADGGKVGEAGL